MEKESERVIYLIRMVVPSEPLLQSLLFKISFAVIRYQQENVFIRPLDEHDSLDWWHTDKYKMNSNSTDLGAVAPTESIESPIRIPKAELFGRDRELDDLGRFLRHEGAERKGVV